VRVRELVPNDVHVLHAVFDGLSPRSRYLRYQTVVPDLSPSTVRALATPNGRDHIALGAFEDMRPIGIARLFGLGGGRAELAVEVVDDRQGCGTGTRLVRAARDRAAQLGHRMLVAEVLADNHRMHALLRREFPGAIARRHGAETTYQLPVADPAALELDEPANARVA
jgi:RimJ/RimL family protein N-acetyltransferase